MMIIRDIETLIMQAAVGTGGYSVRQVRELVYENSRKHLLISYYFYCIMKYISIN